MSISAFTNRCARCGGWFRPESFGSPCACLFEIVTKDETSEHTEEAMKLPEPVAWMWGTHDGIAGSPLTRFGPTNPYGGIEAEPLFTADQLRAVRDEALEEAARKLEPTNPKNDWTEYARIRVDCASAIRAMKDQTQGNDSASPSIGESSRNTSKGAKTP